MKNFLLKYKLAILGIIVGAVLGYLYYYLVGCSTGTCPITSNPMRMTLYGALLGGLFFDIFRKDTKNKKEQNEINV